MAKLNNKLKGQLIRSIHLWDIQDQKCCVFFWDTLYIPMITKIAIYFDKSLTSVVNGHFGKKLRIWSKKLIESFIKISRSVLELYKIYILTSDVKNKLCNQGWPWRSKSITSICQDIWEELTYNILYRFVHSI